MNKSNGWLIPVSELEPGASAIIGDNYIAFYLIHSTALLAITASVFTSLAVVLQILVHWKRGISELDISTRFPLYCSFFDAIYGIVNFSGHFYLVTVQLVPVNHPENELLSLLMSTLFGYTHLTRAGISMYTYCHIVHHKRLNLGRWEWKLHAFELSFVFTIIPALYYCKSFGFSGYWMAYDARTYNGLLIVMLAGIFSSLNATCTTFGYYGIRKTVTRVRQQLEQFTAQKQIFGLSQQMGYHSTALQCLTTYIWIGCFLYCPLAVIVWIFLWINIQFRAVDPFTSFLLVAIANSSGWATACGYFYNERAKRNWKRRKGSANDRYNIS